MYLKKVISYVASATFVIGLFPIEALSVENQYVALRGSYGDIPSVDRDAGIYHSSNNYNSAYGIGLAYGAKMNSWLRVEGEFSYMQADLESITNSNGVNVDASGKETFYSLMVNAIVDWKNDTSFTPYVGAGIGGAHVSHDVTFIPTEGADVLKADSNDVNFAWQVMLGSAYKFNETWSMDFMYRYVGIQSRTHTQDNDKPDIDMDPTHIHQAVLGMRYNF